MLLRHLRAPGRPLQAHAHGWLPGLRRWTDRLDRIGDSRGRLLATVNEAPIDLLLQRIGIRHLLLQKLMSGEKHIIRLEEGAGPGLVGGGWSALATALWVSSSAA